MLRPRTTAAIVAAREAGIHVLLVTGRMFQSVRRYALAGSTGKIGPDLDKLADYAKKANQPLVDFTSGAITSPPPSYVPPGFKNVMPTTFGQTIKPQQLADLVAFLTQKS